MTRFRKFTGLLVATSLLAALYPAHQILKKRLSECLSEKH